MDWREEYRDLGFVVFEKLLPHDLIDAHVAKVTTLLHDHGANDALALSRLDMTADDALMVDMLALHQRSEIARRLIFDRTARVLLHQLFGEHPRLAMARSALWEQGNMRAHIDTAFRSPEPPYSLCRTWCALEDIHPESGRFYLVPGTHRSLIPALCDEVLEERPELFALFKQIEHQPESWFCLRNRAWPRVSAKVAERIEDKAKISFDLNKGDVVFFNPAVVHGTLACVDPSVSRKMMVCEWTTEKDIRLPQSMQSEAFHDRRPTLPVPRHNLVDIRAFLSARATSR
jgi:ectoine hydroxylase-related dioxygenase (phytanoyl-CoA dioxygenase family)